MCLFWYRHMHALTIFPVVYTLELEDGYYYVGATHNLNQRLSQHISGIGAKFMRVHAFKRVHAIQVVQNGEDALDVENAVIWASRMPCMKRRYPSFFTIRATSDG